MLLRPTPLTPSAFAPFGAVLAHDGSTARTVNAGTAWRTDLGGLADRDAGAAPTFAVYCLASQALPLPIRLFERHPGSCQTFAPLTVERFLVVVAPAGLDGLPDPAGVRAFLGGRGDAIRYARDQWHAPHGGPRRGWRHADVRLRARRERRYGRTPPADGRPRRCVNLPETRPRPAHAA